MKVSRRKFVAAQTARHCGGEGQSRRLVGWVCVSALPFRPRRSWLRDQEALQAHIPHHQNQRRTTPTMNGLVLNYICKEARSASSDEVHGSCALTGS
jgi:hypothetical protein